MITIEKIYKTYEDGGYKIPVDMSYGDCAEMIDRILRHQYFKVRDKKAIKMAIGDIEFRIMTSEHMTMSQKIKGMTKLSMFRDIQFDRHEIFTEQQRKKLAPYIAELFKFCSGQLKGVGGNAIKIKICSSYILDGFDYKEYLTLEDRAILINNILRLAKSEDSIKFGLTLLDRTKEYIALRVLEENIVLADYSIVERCIKIFDNRLIDNSYILYNAIDLHRDEIIENLNKLHQERVASVVNLKRP